MQFGKHVPEPVRRHLRPAGLLLRQVREGFTLTELGYARELSFSQFGEDLALLHHFREVPTGFFVDVGALHPFFASNTAALSRRGWRGINLEPVPEALARIARARPRDLNLPYAVSDTPGRFDFVSNDLFSGMAGAQYPWTDPARDPARTISVEARRLDDLLDEYLPAGQHIDLLCVDCEGYDFEVIRSNDWGRYRPSVVLVERHGNVPAERDPVQLLRQHGYRVECEMTLTYMMLDTSEESAT
jgi:FkbM family methyltransferase